MPAVLLCDISKSAAEWEAALKSALPDVNLRIYPDIGAREDIVCAIAWAPPQGLLASLPNLKFVQSLGAGVDHLVRDPTYPRSVATAALRHEAIRQRMARYVLSYALAIAQGHDHYRQLQEVETWDRRLSKSFPSVGVLGLGWSGRTIALALKSAGFIVRGWRRKREDIEGVECFVGADGLESIARQSDILVCALALSEGTKGVLNKGLFAQLPEGAAIINIGRGGHLVEEDLLLSLHEGHLSRAVLDVFTAEPLPSGHPFWREPNITVTPHVAGVVPALVAVESVAVNIRAVLSGAVPPSDFNLT